MQSKQKGTKYYIFAQKNWEMKKSFSWPWEQSLEQTMSIFDSF